MILHQLRHHKANLVMGLISINKYKLFQNIFHMLPLIPPLWTDLHQIWMDSLSYYLMNLLDFVKFSGDWFWGFFYL